METNETRMSFVIPKDMLLKFREYAENNDMRMSQILRNYIRSLIDVKQE